MKKSIYISDSNERLAFEPVLCAGDFTVGDTFLIRKNGRGYTVVDKADTSLNEASGAKYNWVIAVCDGINYAFDSERRVFACT